MGLNKANAPVLLAMVAVVVTLVIGTCSTNARIDTIDTWIDYTEQQRHRPD